MQSDNSAINNVNREQQNLAENEGTVSSYVNMKKEDLNFSEGIHTCKLLSTVRVHIRDILGNWHTTRVLLDSCSQPNVITRELRNKLDLAQIKTNIPITGIVIKAQSRYMA